MLLLLLINLTQQSIRIRSQENHTHKQELPRHILQMAHKTQAVYVLNVTSAYDVHVFEDSDGSDPSDSPIETPYLSLDNLDMEKLEVQNECVGFPKHPQLKQIMNYHLTNATEDSYYTDMVTLSEYSNMFLMTQELLLIQLKLRCGDSGWIATESQKVFDLKTLLKLSNSAVKANALFSCPKMHINCLIITPYGGFWLSKFADFDSDLMPIQPIPEPEIHKRKIINKVSTYEEYLAIAIGEEGVDLYTYQETERNIYHQYIKYITTITKTLFKQQTINIISVKVKDDYIYCLDLAQGLYIFNNINHPKLLMEIHIPRTVAFDVYENTVLVVAQTPSNIEYILEIFVDKHNNTYYVNRVYVDDFTFRDLQIDPNYAFLIGEEANLIIKHSISNTFVQNSSQLVLKFYEKQLVRFELYSQSDSPMESRFKETSFYVGLSRESVHVWKFADYHAFLLCSFDQRSEHTFTVKFNSTSCSDTAREDIFRQCQTKQAVYVQVSGPLFEANFLTIIVLTLILAGVLYSINQILLCIICICVFFRWRRLVRELEAKKYKISEMERYGHFQDNDRI